MEDQIETPQAIERAEALLKDRFSQYLIVASDGDHVFAYHSGNVAALGLGRYAQLMAEQELLKDA